MGVALKRRDNAPILKDVYQSVINAIMHDRDMDKTVQITRDYMDRIIGGEFGIKKFTITKALRASYAVAQVHKAVADRVGERDPGNRPKPGDRVSFVYFDRFGATRDSKHQGDRAETPEFILKTGLQIDYKHYITNQLMSPLTSLFEFYWPDTSFVRPELRRDKIEMRRAMDNLVGKSDKEFDKMISKEIQKDIERVVFASAIQRAVQARVDPIDVFGM
jgi:hypothetical protein